MERRLHPKFPCGTGALLYSPATSTTIARAVLQGNIPTPYALALCLEDTVSDNHVDQAIATLVSTLATLYQAGTQGLPPIFIRVRTPQQIPLLVDKLGHLCPLVEGIVAPKITPNSLVDYVTAIQSTGEHLPSPWSLMPVLETPELVDLRRRVDFLYQIKEKLSPISGLIPSVRVGGNDLCHLFGLRRDSTTTIHQIPVISQLFGDIIAIFSQEYPVAGAVWEYYDGPHWDSGLSQEVKQDRTVGFLGKTVIHPKQIPLVNGGYQVSPQDYADACSILNWDPQRATMVEGSALKQRMN